jgi:octaprenyl-diphosphate synthase
LLEQATAPLVCATKAKRARARLLFAFAELAHVDTDVAIECARAVELIHAASLLHDDVVDEADERRGLPSANALFGNAAAVLAGDHVLATALLALKFDLRRMSAAVDVVERMSRAAVREIEIRDSDAGERELIEVAQGKTAALFGLCGTLVSLDDDRYRRAGEALGLAFQIADDLADVDEDRRERSRTLPLLWGDRARERTHEFVHARVDEARAALAIHAGARAHEAIFAFASSWFG